MKIYTKTGDGGETSLGGGKRVSKADAAIECVGTLDELNAWLGLMACQKIGENWQKLFREVQGKIFIIGSIVSDCANNKIKENYNIQNIDVETLEQLIDNITEGLPHLEHFILPGEDKVVSSCHITRAVCRRAERKLVAVNDLIDIDNVVIEYLNRLSDFLFTLARKISQDRGVEESEWKLEN